MTENSQKNQPIRFRDENRNLRRELLTDEAKDWAEKVGKKVSYTQLRKFYSEVLSIQSRMKDIPDENESFKKYEAVIGMLISKANYAKIRSKKRRQKDGTEVYEYEQLYNFIDCSVSSIHKKQDFDDFVLFFEAVLGFFPRKN